MSGPFKGHMHWNKKVLATINQTLILPRSTQSVCSAKHLSSRMHD